MNIGKLLAQGHSKANTMKIAAYVNTDKQRFAELIKTYLAGPYRITQRAAWPLSYCVMANPHLIGPHLSKVIDFMQKPGVHVAVKRNTVRLLQDIEIPSRLEGKIATICFAYLNDPKEAIAVKAFSMTVLGKIARKHPELKSELIASIELLLPFGSSGIVSRSRKVLKQLKG